MDSFLHNSYDVLKKQRFTITKKKCTFLQIHSPNNNCFKTPNIFTMLNYGLQIGV